MIYKICHAWISGYLFIMLGISGCAGLLSPQKVEEPPPEDIILAMKIKAKLIEAKELNAAAINVKASNGLVRLSGFVETESQRQLAGKITRRISNVKQVDNQILIK
jgi:osmotically-inducible protein OsmY